MPDSDVDVEHRLAGDGRNSIALRRPWVTMVMISSLDGAATIDGLSGGLGGPADLRVLLAARGQADAIVVGATTVSSEDYSPTKATMAIISGSLSLSPSAKVFSRPDRRPIIYTTTDAARTRGSDFDGIATIVDLGDSIEPARVLADLFSRGSRTVCLEGGPSVNGQFVAAGLIDEVLLTIAAAMAAGPAPRIAHSTKQTLLGFELARVWTADDLVFLRYLNPDSQVG